MEILHQDIMYLHVKDEIVFQCRVELWNMDFKKTRQIFSKELIIAVNSLKKDKNIVIKISDK